MQLSAGRDRDPGTKDGAYFLGSKAARSHVKAKARHSSLVMSLDLVSIIIVVVISHGITAKITYIQETS